MIFFLKDNDDCPTCKQHIDETFKSETIKEKNEQQKELSKGLTKLHDQLERLDTYVDTHRYLESLFERMISRLQN